ncbi:MAG: hypothetical protein AABY10_03790, partial [Nanoarchaeota archaeon]
MAELIIDVRSTVTESAKVIAPFDQGLYALIENGFGIISLVQNAKLRVQQGKGSDISKNGNLVREGVIYTPNGTPKLVRNSPI